jgi:hypothetical protein
MANTIDSNLYPDLYAGVHEIGKQVTGCINSVNVNFGSEPVNVGMMDEDQTTVYVPVAGEGSVESYTPSQNASAGQNLTHSYVSVQITESRDYDFHFSTAEEKALNAPGNDNAKSLFNENVKIGMKKLLAEIEEDLAGDIYKNASRARGTAGTTPFGSNLAPLTACYSELVIENGAPDDDISFVMSKEAAENFMNLAIVQQADKAGSDSFLRQGELLNHIGFSCKISTKFSSHDVGGGTDPSGYQINNDSDEAVGQTTLTVDSGSNNIVAGDIFYHADATDENYVVTSGVTGGSGDLTIGEPGLLTKATDDAALTFHSAYTPNIALHKNAYVLATRPPMLEANNEIDDVQMLTDPDTGLSFALVKISGDGMTTYRVHIAWGYDVINEDFIVVYMG